MNQLNALSNRVEYYASPHITITTTEVIIETRGRTLIVPREVHEATQTKNPEVQEGLRRTFEPLQRDTSVTEFALTNRMDDPDPPSRTIPRSNFLAAGGRVVFRKTRKSGRQERLPPHIAKCPSNLAKRKWSFE